MSGRFRICSVSKYYVAQDFHQDRKKYDDSYRGDDREGSILHQIECTNEQHYEDHTALETTSDLFSVLINEG